VLSVKERLAIARQLAELGVDVIDAAYPAFSAEEQETLSQIAGGARALGLRLEPGHPKDVESVLALLAAAARPTCTSSCRCRTPSARVLGKPGRSA